MSNIRSILLILVIGAQVLWLAVHYAAGFRTLDEAPRLRVVCRFHDPHDFFRGDYVAFRCMQDIDSEEGVVEASLLEQDGRKDVSLFWKEEPNGLWKVVRVEKPDGADDAVREGEVRTQGILCVPAAADADSAVKQPTGGEEGTQPNVCLKDQSGGTFLRFYLPERKADLQTAWFHAHPGDGAFPQEKYELTADIAVRPDNSLFPIMLYVNGVPWPEAFEQIEKGSL